MLFCSPARRKLAFVRVGLRLNAKIRLFCISLGKGWRMCRRCISSILYCISVAGRRVNWCKSVFLSLTGAAGERRRPICGAGPAENNRPAPEAGPSQRQTCARGRAFFVTMWARIHPKLGILPTVRAAHTLYVLQNCILWPYPCTYLPRIGR